MAREGFSPLARRGRRSSLPVEARIKAAGTHVDGQTERQLEAIANIAREQLLHHAWSEIEPLLAEGWEEFRALGVPAWAKVAREVRRRACPPAGLCPPPAEHP